MNRRGFTLIELIVALVLMGIISGAIYQLLVTNQRVYRNQTQRADLNANLRTVVSLLPTELWELNAGDAIASDILVMSADSIAYKAARSMYTLCSPPTVSTPTSGTVVLGNRWYGVRPFDGKRDGVMLFAEGDRATRLDNVWVHAEPSGTASAATCADGSAGITFSLKNIAPAGWLAAVDSGAPLRVYEVMKVKTYTDAYGDYWVGTQRLSLPLGWAGLEPVLGPIAASGLQFEYFDNTGLVTADPTQVARIRITVIGRTHQAVSTAGGQNEHVVDTLVTQVALRNNIRQ